MNIEDFKQFTIKLYQRDLGKKLFRQVPLMNELTRDNIAKNNIVLHSPFTTDPAIITLPPVFKSYDPLFVFTEQYLNKDVRKGLFPKDKVLAALVLIRLIGKNMFLTDCFRVYNFHHKKNWLLDWSNEKNWHDFTKSMFDCQKQIEINTWGNRDNPDEILLNIESFFQSNESAYNYVLTEINNPQSPWGIERLNGWLNKSFVGFRPQYSYEIAWHFFNTLGIEAYDKHTWCNIGEKASTTALKILHRQQDKEFEVFRIMSVPEKQKAGIKMLTQILSQLKNVLRDMYHAPELSLHDLERLIVSYSKYKGH